MPKAHDQRFWPQVLKANSLLTFDMGYINFEIFAKLTLAHIKFITRAKSNLVYSFERALMQTATVHDSLVWIGPEDSRQVSTAVLVDLADSVAKAPKQPFAVISIEMIYRSLYFFTQAHQRSQTEPALP